MSGERLVKGVNLVGLVKLLRARRRKQPLRGLSPEAEALLDQQILVSSWYPLEPLWDLLNYVYDTMLGRSEDAALTLGIAGGDETWQGAHRAYLVEGDPSYALRYMSTAWSSYFNFGGCRYERMNPNAVRLSIHGIPDLPAAHGMTMAGWHLSAARLAGWPEARLEVQQRPWRGDPELVYEIHQS